ncbi:MAG: hypothetical protein CMM25_04945 [Rhodospirillaceae bacterium]|nr:hypothetical protein [Rhodospirillaceae bacterium]
MKNNKSLKNIVPNFLVNHLGLANTDELQKPLDKGPRINSIGDLLCSERMRINADLQEIAELLRIRYSYLVAIEDGRYDDLPGLVYSRGFIRAYADYLGLDGAEVVKQFRKERELPAATISAASAPDFEDFSLDDGVPTGSILVLALAMGAIMYTSWFVLFVSNNQTVDLIQAVPERMSALLGNNELELSDDQRLNFLISLEPNSLVAEKPFSDDGGTAFLDENSMTATDEASDTLAVTDKILLSQGSITSDSSEGENIAADDRLRATDISDNQFSVKVVNSPAIVNIEGPTEVKEDVGSVVGVVAPSQDMVSSNTSKVTKPLDKIRPSVAKKNKEVASSAEKTGSSREQPNVSQKRKTPALNASDIETDQSQSVKPVITPKIVTSGDTTPLLSNTVTIKTRDNDSRVGEQLTDKVEKNNSAITEETVSIEKVSKDTIEIKARSDTWIQVRNGQKLMLTKFLRSGATYRVPPLDGLTLMTGNAGGLDVYIGGEFVRKLGKDGEVLRAVPLDIESIQTNLQPID